MVENIACNWMNAKISTVWGACKHNKLELLYTITFIIANYVHLISQIVKDPSIFIEEILLSSKEYAGILL